MTLWIVPKVLYDISYSKFFENEDKEKEIKNQAANLRVFATKVTRSV